MRSMDDLIGTSMDGYGSELLEPPPNLPDGSSPSFNHNYVSEVFGEFRITNLPYKPTLKNTTSPDFLFLSTQLLSAVSVRAHITNECP